MNRSARFATTVVATAGLSLAGLGLGAGIANAGGPYQWCPGDEAGGYGGGFNTPADARPNWDWNICHTFYTVNWGQGNVSPTIWDGENPPPDSRGPVGPCSLLDTRGC